MTIGGFYSETPDHVRPPEIHQSWSKILRDGEKLLWHATPKKAFAFYQKKDTEFSNLIKLSWFFVLPAAFFYFFNYLFWDQEFSVSYLLLITFLLGLSAAFAILPSFRLLTNTRYALTNQRAIIARGKILSLAEIKSYEITWNSPIEMQTRNPSNVFFAEEILETENGHLTRQIGFLELKDPQIAFDILIRLRARVSP